ncbi:MAG: protein-glutamate O-methyltransferase CheR [Nitrospirota bacterium]
MNNYTNIMTTDEFNLFRNLIHNESGIFIKESRKDFLRTRIEKRLREQNIGSYFRYYKHVTDYKNKKELFNLLESVTINETYFFRNMPQFEILKKKVLLDLLERKRKRGDFTLRLWSAGCATGEEPYSIAIAATETIPDISRWNLKIIGSDISLRCLEIAQSGIYHKEKLKDIPEQYLKNYFISTGEFYEMRDDIKRFVEFDYHNLKHENGIAEIDVIFCRNVLIYFNAEEQKRIITNFKRILNEGGYLFLGHAESLQGISNGDFKFVYSNKGAAYQKIERVHD